MYKRQCLQKRFGLVEGITDKNYITNSYHIHVTEHINAFDKLAFESQFQALSPGGAISYVEVPNMQTNLDAELEVMQAIWACEEPVKRAAISAILDRTHPMAPTTLLTVLSRLADKGFVRIEKTGRSAEYRPLVAKEDYLARQGRKFYDKLCGGSVSAFAAALSASGLTAEELAQLRELLREDAL